MTAKGLFWFVYSGLAVSGAAFWLEFFFGVAG